MSDKELVIMRLEIAMAEARRFLDRADNAREALVSDKESTFNSPMFAATKRASMDLTRELARLRRWRDE